MLTDKKERNAIMSNNRNNRGSIVLALGCVAVSMSACAQFTAAPVPGPDAFNMMIRNQLSEMVHETPASSENPLDYFNKAWEATETERWGEAVRALKRCIEIEKESGIFRSDCNIADNYVWLAMLQWNDNEPRSARSSMEEAIRLMKYGESLGQGCEKLAEKFLAKMQSGDLPSRFTPTDILSDCGIHKNIMVPVMARFWKCTNASIARSNLVISWAESMSRTYQMEGERQARMARQGARQEYLRKTGREFSPDSDTRLSYGKARDEWDACKCVYDIFE